MHLAHEHPYAFNNVRVEVVRPFACCRLHSKMHSESCKAMYQQVWCQYWNALFQSGIDPLLGQADSTRATEALHHSLSCSANERRMSFAGDLQLFVKLLLSASNS